MNEKRQKKYSFGAPLNLKWNGVVEECRITHLRWRNELGIEKYHQRNRWSGAVT